MTSLLTKKERGKLRYDRQQTSVSAERIRTSRSHPSDIAPPRLGEGIPPQHASRVSGNYTPPRKMIVPLPKGITLRAIEEVKHN
jgi:hypothetical protein